MPEYNSAFTADRIKQLLKERKMSVSKMLTDCDINKNALYTMQASGYLPARKPSPASRTIWTVRSTTCSAERTIQM